MVRVLLLAMLCLLFGSIESSSAQHRRFLSRIGFRADGPIQIPIPAIGPWFPGGTVTLQPREGGTEPRETPSGKVYVSNDVKTRLDRIDALIKGDVLTKTKAIPKVFNGRDYPEIPGLGTTAPGKLAGRDAPNLDDE